jgi:hypothetical protein
MEKLVVGPSSKDIVDLDAPVADNLRAIARRLDTGMVMRRASECRLLLGPARHRCTGAKE